MVGELLVCSKSLVSITPDKWFDNYIYKLFILGVNLGCSLSKYIHYERAWQKIKSFLSCCMFLMLTGRHDEIGTLRICPRKHCWSCFIRHRWHVYYAAVVRFCHLDLSTVILWQAFHVYWSGCFQTSHQIKWCINQCPLMLLKLFLSGIDDMSIMLLW